MLSEKNKLYPKYTKSIRICKISRVHYLGHQGVFLTFFTKPTYSRNKIEKRTILL